jgi:hypothetical protein
MNKDHGIWISYLGGLIGWLMVGKKWPLAKGRLVVTKGGEPFNNANSWQLSFTPLCLLWSSCIYFLKGWSCFIRCFGGHVLKVYVVGTQCLKWWSPFIIVPGHLWPITHWKNYAIEMANKCSHSRDGTIQKKLFQECVPIHKVYKVMIYVMFWLKKIGFQIERISYYYILHLVVFNLL